MTSWIFQGNPDTFDIDAYLSKSDHVLWSVRQRHLAKTMEIGDEVFLWRAAGSRKAISGVIAYARVSDTPKELPDDEAPYWTDVRDAGVELRVKLDVIDRFLAPKSVIRSDWIKDDPILRDLRILRMRNETNYQITAPEAQRLAVLARNTGKDWTREESVAGLWAFAQTEGREVSKLPGSPVSLVALAIGRAVSGVYNKVMNFRSLDPRDARKGFTAINRLDQEVWAEFFDKDKGHIRTDVLDLEYHRLWKTPSAEGSTSRQNPTYRDFGEAPNDDPAELARFAARVRRGQPKFRKNLLHLYGGRCCVSGWGPEEVLEAAHVLDHAGSGINRSDNGLLLRSDLHQLFDVNLLRIDPDTLSVVIDSRLKRTEYWALNGVPVRPRVDGSALSIEYLRSRWKSASR